MVRYRDLAKEKTGDYMWEVEINCNLLFHFSPDREAAANSTARLGKELADDKFSASDKTPPAKQTSDFNPEISHPLGNLPLHPQRLAGGWYYSQFTDDDDDDNKFNKGSKKSARN